VLEIEKMGYKKYLKKCKEKIKDNEKCLCCNINFEECPIKEEMEQEAERFYQNV